MSSRPERSERIEARIRGLKRILFATGSNPEEVPGGRSCWALQKLDEVEKLQTLQNIMVEVDAKGHITSINNLLANQSRPVPVAARVVTSR